MFDDVLSIKQAYIALQDGLAIRDFSNNRYKLKDEKVVVKNDHARFYLSVEDFLNLYKEKKFIILDDTDNSIDTKKDDEYYGFKHK